MHTDAQDTAQTTDDYSHDCTDPMRRGTNIVENGFITSGITG
jgi:hypothetical protein